MNDIQYTLKWSDQINDGLLEDILKIENAVFGGFSIQLLKRKIESNIYGSSLITIAYQNEEPIGADIMLRNDILGHVGFESIDTCVSEKCRGKGVFISMTTKEVAEIKKKYPNAVIYGFPNGNSFPGYIKMGWTIQCRFIPAPFLSPFIYNKENPNLIDLEYAKWLKMSDHKFYYTKIGRKLYLIKKGTKHFQMVGRLEPAATSLFERDKHPGIIKCFIKRHSFFHNKKYQGSIITYGKTPFDIPYWKHDAFIG